MARNVRRVAIAVGVLLIVAVSQAADINKAISEAESRKRAAENGLKEIKAKAQPSEQIRTAYTEAATGQNAWLDLVCQAIEQGATAAPDVAASAQSAATSLVEWVNVRNKALGLPELTGVTADSVKKSVAQELMDIASGTWKSNRSADPKKRSGAATSLKERLRWKAFDQL